MYLLCLLFDALHGYLDAGDGLIMHTDKKVTGNSSGDQRLKCVLGD